MTVDHFRKTDGGERSPTDLATAMMQVCQSPSTNESCWQRLSSWTTESTAAPHDRTVFHLCCCYNATAVIIDHLSHNPRPTGFGPPPLLRHNESECISTAGERGGQGSSARKCAAVCVAFCVGKCCQRRREASAQGQRRQRHIAAQQGLCCVRQLPAHLHSEAPAGKLMYLSSWSLLTLMQLQLCTNTTNRQKRWAW